MAEQLNKWLPPGLHDLLACTLPEGTQWYEVRMITMCRSFEMQEYDVALSVAKVIKKLCPSTSLYYCWAEDGELCERQVW